MIVSEAVFKLGRQFVEGEILTVRPGRVTALYDIHHAGKMITRLGTFRAVFTPEKKLIPLTSITVAESPCRCALPGQTCPSCQRAARYADYVQSVSYLHHTKRQGVAL